MPLSPLFLALSTLSILVNSQSCTQFGTPESNGTCSNCPPGFGGNDCNTLLCSNPLIAPSSRSTFDPNVSGDAAVGCNNQCTSGFEGPNCNVCNSNQACSNALSSTPTMASQGLGEPICSTGAWTWTQGFGNCAVVVSFSFFYLFSFLRISTWLASQRSPTYFPLPLCFTRSLPRSPHRIQHFNPYSLERRLSRFRKLLHLPILCRKILERITRSPPPSSTQLLPAIQL